MGTGTPPRFPTNRRETKVFDYTIPIEVGGEPAKVNGTLTWVGTGWKASVIPFVILGLAIIAAIVLADPPGAETMTNKRLVQAITVTAG